MLASRWRVLDYETEVAWLAAFDPDGDTTGFEVGDSPASVWVLNSIYRFDAVGTVPTHDEIRRKDLRLGTAKPVIFNGVDLDAIGILSGVSVGFSRRPAEPHWYRVRWIDLADELGVTLEDMQYPSTQWFPYRSWPANILPPAEGSLDEATLHALLPHLLRHGGGGECIAAYAITAAGPGRYPDRCFSGPVNDLVHLVGRSRPGTPSNFWATDRSWIVYTDWDLSGSKICGTPELIAALRADPDLETILPSARP